MLMNFSKKSTPTNGGGMLLAGFSRDCISGIWQVVPANVYRPSQHPSMPSDYTTLVSRRWNRSQKTDYTRSTTVVTVKNRLCRRMDVWNDIGMVITFELETLLAVSICICVGILLVRCRLMT